MTATVPLIVPRGLSAIAPNVPALFVPNTNVRGPKHVVKKGRTPLLDRDEARALLAVIDTSSLIGLRVSALIGTIARIGAVLRRGWVRIHEKGGKEHEAPCHHKLETYLDEYIAAAGIAGETDGPLFRTTGQLTGTPHRMTQPDAYRAIQKHGGRPGSKPKSAITSCGRPRHYRLPEKCRHARTRASDGKPFLAAHDQTLRPARR